MFLAKFDNQLISYFYTFANGTIITFGIAIKIFGYCFCFQSPDKYWNISTASPKLVQNSAGEHGNRILYSYIYSCFQQKEYFSATTLTNLNNGSDTSTMFNFYERPPETD